MMTAAIAHVFAQEPTFMARAHNHDLLSSDEMTRLFRLAKQGDSKARDRIASSNLRLVLSMTRNYLRTHPKAVFDDVYDQGVEGLMIAINKFDPEFGARFSTYATPWIRCKIEEYLMVDRQIHVPLHTVKAASKVNRTRRTLERSFGRTVADAEIADELNMEVSAVRSLTMAIQPVTSLDLPITDDEESVTFLSLVESPTNDIDTLERDNVRHMLMNAIKTHLDDREQFVLLSHFGLGDGEEMNHAEVGRELNLSRERIRQIMLQGLAKLKDVMTKQNLDFSSLI